MIIDCPEFIEKPIGFMDSGLGGLSVLREAIKIMPNEDFIYYGDSLNAPYGTKKTDEIKQLTFNVVDKLLSYGIKGLAVACNTATGAAVRQLRVMYPDLSIVGIEPAIKPAAVASNGGRVLVMATPMTIAQEKFRRLLSRYEKMCEIVPIPCDGLMEFVEKGDLEGVFLREYFEKYLTPYLTDDTETIVLGCTHYPFLRPYLKKFLGKRKIDIIDGSYGTSLELKRRIKEKGLLREENNNRSIIIENSTGKQEMIDLSWKLLSLPMD